jgi:hypothetical protein
MIEKIKSLLFRGSNERAFINAILELDKREGNNYQFGSAVREKVRLYRKGIIETSTETKKYSH